MPLYAIIAFVLLGLCAGWIGGMLLKRRGFGVVGPLVAGVLGASAAGVAFSLFGFSEPGAGGSLLAASAGAVLVLFALGLLKRKTRGGDGAAIRAAGFNDGLAEDE
jgi:uncharacterized membrane protein YeaQ/YmgE (transglycosylase-associated protein family)